MTGSETALSCPWFAFYLNSLLDWVSLNYIEL